MMAYFAKLILAIALVLNSGPPGDYITAAANALQRGPVYVAPDTEGTNSGTATQLLEVLDNDDNIVLVMLPTAAAQHNTDPITLAIRLSKKLGNQRIIGLAVGNNVVGYAPMLPSGVAADQMDRAANVSNDNPITTLKTFAQNMHQLESDHPEYKKPLQTNATQNGGVSWIIWASLLACAFASIVFLLTVARSSVSTQESSEGITFRIPDQLRDLFSRISQEREQVSDGELRETLRQMFRDIERYFQSTSKDEGVDTRFFQERLTEISSVLSKYLDAQENPRYYHYPNEVLQSGKASITGFSQSVLESIQRGNDVALRDYAINTSILQIQRRINEDLDL